MAEFDVSGKWFAIHSVRGIVDFEIVQAFNSPKFTGEAFLRDTSIASRSLDGSVHENQFFANVIWNDGANGEYHGIFSFHETSDGREGRIWGVTFNANKPEVQATWVSNKNNFKLFNAD